ncbi:MAG: ASKHA domain-containing protein [Chloroflexota bacterium]|nr:ASKHA domain-containing protein [Chloroflexota bacterium]
MAEKENYTMIHVDFEPVGRRGQCSPDQSLLDCARQLGVDLVNLCGGAGTCGRCRVQIVSGRVSEVTPKEREVFNPQELADGLRMACCVTPLSDCKVRVPPESLTAPQRTQVEGQEVAVRPEPPVQVYSVQLSPPSFETDDLRADAGRLLNALAQQHQVNDCGLDTGVLRVLSPQLRDNGWQATVAVREDEEIVALLSASHRPLGLAVDLGTTKIASYLVDVQSGQTLASQGVMNPQIAYGEDLIARMARTTDSPDEAVRLQEMVVAALNQLATDMCAEVDADRSQIVEAVVVGNTAMHHLFLRLPVKQLARAPYVPAVESALDIKAREVGLRIAPGAYVHLLPNIAGYVGADHVAMLLATGVSQAEGVVLALDIGTNTEVCLVNHGTMTSVSCASGPAFEGAHIKHGMRAAQGAIEHVRLVDGRVEYQTIGGAPPVGLCGSGILDSLAELYRAGVVKASGRMSSGHPGVRETDGMREFVLVGEEGQGAQPAITITQKDVRELQLAKGAMRAGVQMLLEEQGLSEEEIDRVIIAGAFGTYIDVTSAITIGMLPSLPLDRFQQVGNAAGMGAKLSLISRSKRVEAQHIARRVGYVELATSPRFMQIFTQAMLIG